MGEQPRDIQTADDVARLVRAFYGRAMTDPVIGFFFADVARVDLDEHVPVVAAFWETILLGTGAYRGGAFAPHVSLHRLAPLQRGHFDRWLVLWRTTVDELFAGERAELAKGHALRVARAFESRLQGFGDPAPGGGLVVSLHGPG